MKIIIAIFLIILISWIGSRQVSSTTLTIGKTNITVKIADTNATRAHGLSRRPSLAENTGMLFIFDRADYHNFWMKDMHFPIDIIWLDDDWRVIDITANAAPIDFPKNYQPHSPARYVLEVNAGFTAVHHITIGVQAVLKQ